MEERLGALKAWKEWAHLEHLAQEHDLLWDGQKTCLKSFSFSRSEEPWVSHQGVLKPGLKLMQGHQETCSRGHGDMVKYGS